MTNQRQSEARLRIRKHIRTRGDEPVTLTPIMVLRWWNLLNDAVFYGMLTKPIEITLKHHRHAHAYAIAEMPKGFVSLSICPKFTSRKVFLQVLVHEMVHAWECVNYNRMGHGKRFHEWRGRIWWALRLKLRVKI